MITLATLIRKYGWEIRAYLVLLMITFIGCSLLWFCGAAGRLYYNVRYDFPLIEFWPPFTVEPGDRYLVSPFLVWICWIITLLTMLLIPFIIVYPFLAAKRRVAKILLGQQSGNCNPSRH